MRVASIVAVLAAGLLALSACTTDHKTAQKPVAETTGTQTSAPQTAQTSAPQTDQKVAAAEPAPKPAAKPRPAADANTLIMQLKSGTVTIELRPDLAPKAAERLKTLTKQGFYDGLVFHRVIPGFMAQTGDPTGTGAGGSDLPDLKAEFSAEPFARGVIGMARTNDPDSANSQFFITFADSPWLNGQYTVVGKVTSGMEAVDAIKKGSEADNGTVENPDKIISMKLAADAG